MWRRYYKKYRRRWHRWLDKLPIAGIDRLGWLFKHPDRTVRIGIYTSVFGFLLLVGVLATFYVSNQATAVWYNDNWLYRKKITVSNSSGGALTDFQVVFTLDTATLIDDGKLQSACQDIRVTDEDGNVLPHWVEENSPGCDNAATRIWTKVPSISTSGEDLYVYYGNEVAADVESGDDVFEFFDDFSGSSLDTGKWTQKNGGTPTFSGGEMTISAATDPGKMIATAGPTDDNYLMRARYKITAGTSTDERVGLSVKTNTTDGRGYNYVFRNFSTKTLAYFLDDGIVWGSSYSFPWSFDTFYVEDIYHDGTNINARLDDGTWRQWARSSRTGYLALNFGSYSGQATSVWDWAFIRKIVSTEPTTSLASEENLPVSLAAYWKLDEGLENQCSDGTNDICDSSGNQLDGALTGATWQNEEICLAGKCLHFTGNEQYVTVADASELRIGTGDFTIGLWIKTGFPGNTVFISKRDSTGANGWYFGAIETQKLSFVSNGSTTTEASSNTVTFRDNRWHHLAVTRSSGTLTFYLDGFPVGTASDVDDSFSNTDTLLIGKDAGSSNAYVGLMDEIKIYGYARTAAEIKTDAIQMAGSAGASATFGRDLAPFANQGIVGHWRMDESAWSGTAGEVLDTSNMNNHGTRQGDATTTTGKFGNAGTFDGTGDYVALGQNSGLNPAENLTLATWVKPTAVASEQTLIGRWDESGDKRSYRLFINSSAKLCAEITSDGTSGTVYQECTSASVTAGSYTHVGATVEPAGAAGYLDIKLYIGGILQGTNTSGSQTTVIFGG